MTGYIFFYYVYIPTHTHTYTCAFACTYEYVTKLTTKPVTEQEHSTQMDNDSKPL
jgi:hypothetical protein